MVHPLLRVLSLGDEAYCQGQVEGPRLEGVVLSLQKAEEEGHVVALDWEERMREEWIMPHETDV